MHHPQHLQLHTSATLEKKIRKRQQSQSLSAAASTVLWVELGSLFNKALCFVHLEFHRLRCLWLENDECHEKSAWHGAQRWLYRDPFANFGFRLCTAWSFDDRADFTTASPASGAAAALQLPPSQGCVQASLVVTSSPSWYFPRYFA